MDARDDLALALEKIVNGEQWDQVLLAFRKRVATVLHAQFSGAGSMVYLMVYDCGVASELYGPDSAICVGMKRGVDDAVHVSPIRLSQNLLDKAEELGRKHGTLLRVMMEESAASPHIEIEGSSRG